MLVTLALLASACGEKSETAVTPDDGAQPQATSRPDTPVPESGLQMPPLPMRSYLMKHGGEKGISCSSAPHSLDEVVAAYPATDFAGPPTRACTIRYQNGDIVDFLRIKDSWIHLER